VSVRARVASAGKHGTPPCLPEVQDSPMGSAEAVFTQQGGIVVQTHQHLKRRFRLKPPGMRSRISGAGLDRCQAPQPPRRDQSRLPRETGSSARRRYILPPTVLKPEMRRLSQPRSVHDQPSLNWCISRTADQSKIATALGRLDEAEQRPVRLPRWSDGFCVYGM